MVEFSDQRRPGHFRVHTHMGSDPRSIDKSFQIPGRYAHAAIRYLLISSRSNCSILPYIIGTQKIRLYFKLVTNILYLGVNNVNVLARAQGRLSWP